MVTFNTKGALATLCILLVGVVGLFGLMALRPEPPKVEREVVAPLVQIATPEAYDGALVIQGNGTVRPTREINLIAEVAGKIVATDAALVAGGFVRAGTVLARIEATDYENAVAQAEAEVAQRRFELLLAQRESELAREEWERSQRFTSAEQPEDINDEAGSLVLREPQLKLAEAVLAAAEARLADAQTRLGRTAITAPFDGRVRTKMVDVGQYVGPGTPVAMLFATDEVEIAVPLQTDDAALIEDLWTREASGRRARIPAEVASTFGEQRFTWDGYIDRTEGTLDQATRTVNVVVRVPQPYRTAGAGQPPLLVGMFTDVTMDGATVENVHRIPREALREGNRVWTVADGRIAFRTVEPVQAVDAYVLVRGLSGTEQVVTSNLTVITDGMNVRVE